MTHHPLDPATEAEITKLEAAADSFAQAITEHPGDADALWLRVNFLRDRILSGWAEARAEANRIRQERIDANKTRQSEAA